MTQAVRSGITFRPHLPGIVPEYVEREAARFGLYRWIDWCALSIMERLYGIAHYRLHSIIELHEGEAMNAHFEAQSRRRNVRGAGTFAGGRPMGLPVGR